MTPADLERLRALVGDGAIDYTLVVGGFHFINRIADLLHVDSEALPATLRRFEPLRRLAVRMAARMMGRMDLANRVYETGFEEASRAFGEKFERATGRNVGDLLEPLRSRPKVVEALRLAIEERDERSTLDRSTVATVHRVVEDALPAAPGDALGFHARPADPIEAFAFVGTRYAARTTERMIAQLRTQGCGDLGILDLAIAVADANQWARLHRLLGLAPELFYLATEEPGVRQRLGVGG